MLAHMKLRSQFSPALFKTCDVHSRLCVGRRAGGTGGRSPLYALFEKGGASFPQFSSLC